MPITGLAGLGAASQFWVLQWVAVLTGYRGGMEQKVMGRGKLEVGSHTKRELKAGSGCRVELEDLQGRSQDESHQNQSGTA